MKVSVAMTTYNGSAYILEQLESIYRQTRPVDEVIITDDGSTDNTADLVLDFIKTHSLDKSWCYYVNERNLGFGENFKRATYLCTGDVIFFCDQDDIWVDDRVAKMMQIMEKNDDIRVLYTKHRKFTMSDGEKIFEKKEKESLRLKQIKFSPHNRYLRCYGCVMCVRKKFLETLKDDWYLGWAHDEAVWSLSIMRDNIYFYDYVSILYRRHGKNVSGNMGHGKEKRIKYLQSVKESSSHLRKIAERDHLDKKIWMTYNKNLKMAEYRLALVEERKIGNIFRLLPYLRYYYSKKSFLTEIMIAFKG